MSFLAPVGPITRKGRVRLPKCDCSHPVSHRSGMPAVWSEWK